MIKRQLFAFILRWLASSIGMYFCITWLGTINPDSSSIYKYAWVLFAIAGLIFSLINSVIKPLVKMLALPLAILTMGLSTIIINTVMVILTIYLLPGVEMDIWGAVLSSIIMSVINAVMNFLIN
jgi:putative membrane protein